MPSELKELKNQLQTKEVMMSDLNRWLTEKPSHPDRGKIAEDRKKLSVEIYTLQRKIENLENYRPILGDSMGFTEPNAIIQNQINNLS